MNLSLVPLHKHPQYLQECCELLNSEWKRSLTARLHSLESSCDDLPVSFILLQNNRLIGHLKLSSIPSIKHGCFMESVVIRQTERGKGYGRILVQMCEDYCEKNGLNVIYLTTKGQEEFYKKLGFKECLPISIYGYSSHLNISKSITVNSSAPLAPPMPNSNNILSQVKIKTHMKKEL
ncbi:unnamed protein product [Ceutorhynchus assimilis]|uniref:N-acetyltransferase domain-containing protein n=1 Tax=Ceutorhynchus assimilis TaxID=467358 RepID=A0A9N9MRY3_9CUCU|nr:unnamed protein product [Ceutorhynchus assimilis]